MLKKILLVLMVIIMISVFSVLAVAGDVEMDEIVITESSSVVPNECCLETSVRLAGASMRVTVSENFFGGSFPSTWHVTRLVNGRCMFAGSIPWTVAHNMGTHIRVTFSGTIWYIGCIS